MQASLRQLSAGGIERKVTAWTESGAIAYPVTELTAPTGAERLDPGNCHRSEAVV
jgi:hypothetical protein